MILTGKCKEDFEKWLNINFHEFSYRKFRDEYDAHFYKLPFSFQYSVYVDFFDSVGIRIYIDEVPNDGIYYTFNLSLYDGDFLQWDDYSQTRWKAREQAILKANKIHNKNSAG